MTTIANANRASHYLKMVAVFLFTVFLSSCAIVHGKSSPQQYGNDTSITTQIKTKLIASDQVSAPTIHVETQNGIVQLSGFVSTASQALAAERISRSVSGVRGVVNDLVISPARRSRR